MANRNSLFIVLLFISAQLNAAEIASFATEYYGPIEDGSQEVQKLLKQEVKRSLLAVKGCNKKQLTEYLRYNLNSNWGNIRNIILRNLQAGEGAKERRDKAPKFRDMPLELRYYGLENQIKVPVLFARQDQSVYRDLLPSHLSNIQKVGRHLPGGVKNMLSHLAGYDVNAALQEEMCCDGIINMCGTKVGIDKLDHFFGHGYIYYQESRRTNKNDAVSSGEAREHDFWGLGGTGVKSYADLSANYNGMQFWEQFFAPSNPAIVCKNNKFELAKDFDQRFDLCQFFDESFNETINCSSYASKDRAMSISLNIYKISEGKYCPLKPDTCRKLKKKYDKMKVAGRSVSRRILHPNCYNPSHIDPFMWEKATFHGLRDPNFRTKLKEEAIH